MSSAIKTKQKNQQKQTQQCGNFQENENQLVVHLTKILSQVYDILLNWQHRPLQQAGETYKSIFNDSDKPYE